MKKIMLECRDISKTYRRNAIPTMRLQDELLFWHRRHTAVEIHALKPASLSVEKGEWIGIYGPNGSGKTTFMKILAGILRPDTGNVTAAGSMSAFFELGIGFHPERQATENIRINALLSGMRSSEIEELVQKVLAFADIGEHAELPLKCYSTGMRLRLAFAVSAQMDADIYLFDEILAVGDFEFQEKCVAHLQSLKEQGKTVILVSHSYPALLKFCDRIMLFEKGTMKPDPDPWNSPRATTRIL